jgi:DNA-binding MarR family transcriptional regulator
MAPAPTPKEVGKAFAQLLPLIVRGSQADFFVRRGVTQAQFLVLATIHAEGACTMGRLAQNLHVRMPTATGIVDRLVRAGHVRRATDPVDRRQVIVQLTRKGAAFIEHFQEVIQRRWEEILRSLTPQELTMFHHVITKLQQQL